MSKAPKLQSKTAPDTTLSKRQRRPIHVFSFSFSWQTKSRSLLIQNSSVSYDPTKNELWNDAEPLMFEVSDLFDDALLT